MDCRRLQVKTLSDLEVWVYILTRKKELEFK